ncbi:MAG: hypothetical protein EOO24_32490, partial [Comamonadaceae bacterium]
MNPLPTLYIEGPAFWAPTLPGWAAASASWRGEAPPVDPPARQGRGPEGGAFDVEGGQRVHVASARTTGAPAPAPGAASARPNT